VSSLKHILFYFSGKERNLNIVELLCAACSGWYHESCIGYQLGKLVPFMTNYVFFCKNCSPTGLESFKKNQARECCIKFYRYYFIACLFLAFPQMCITAIANLQQDSVKDSKNRAIFSKDREIIPYIEQYWEAMTTMPRRYEDTRLLLARLKITIIIYF
jgi:Set1/Ash2 histone methyltransferase complex subunit ASH2